MSKSAQAEETKSTVENLCRAAGVIYKPPSEHVVFQHGGGHHRPAAPDEPFLVDLDLLEGDSREDRIMSALRALANDLGSEAARSSLEIRLSAEQFIERTRKSGVQFNVFKIEDGQHESYEVMATDADWAKAYVQMAFPKIESTSIKTSELHGLNLDWLIRNWESVDLDWIVRREESRQPSVAATSTEMRR